MKFRGHETFYIRKSWLNKGMRNVNTDKFAFMGETENPMDLFGMGSNMVKSLRYWMQAVGLTEEPKAGKRYQKLTEFGELVYLHDRYTEETGTLWLLHYNLAKNREFCTSWYCFFNEFTLSEFNKNDFIKKIDNFTMLNNLTVAERAFEDDFDCIIKTYIPRSKLSTKCDDPENNIESPFSELNILDIANKKNRTFKKCSPKIDTIHPLIALSIIVDNANGNKEIPISNIQNNYCNLGKVLNLDIITLTNILSRIEMMGYIKVIRTAGLDIVRINTEFDFIQCVEEYYRIINL